MYTFKICRRTVDAALRIIQTRTAAKRNEKTSFWKLQAPARHSPSLYSFRVYSILQISSRAFFRVHPAVRGGWGKKNAGLGIAFFTSYPLFFSVHRNFVHILNFNLLSQILEKLVVKVSTILTQPWKIRKMSHTVLDFFRVESSNKSSFAYKTK